DDRCRRAPPHPGRTHLRPPRRPSRSAARCPPFARWEPGLMSRASAERGDSGPESRPQLRIVILGLSVTSSWGNGHATTYRGLVRELVRRRHQVTFFERNVPWYIENRDLPKPPYGKTVLYDSVDELRQTYADTIRTADLVIVGSYVPDGIEVGHWVCSTARGVTAFYDIDTPVTLASLAAGTCRYLSE